MVDFLFSRLRFRQILSSQMFQPCHFTGSATAGVCGSRRLPSSAVLCVHFRLCFFRPGSRRLRRRLVDAGKCTAPGPSSASPRTAGSRTERAATSDVLRKHPAGGMISPKLAPRNSSDSGIQNSASSAESGGSKPHRGTSEVLAGRGELPAASCSWLKVPQGGRHFDRALVR